MNRIKCAEVPIMKVWGRVLQSLPLEPAAYLETDRNCLFVLTIWKTTEESKDGRKEGIGFKRTLEVQMFY